MTTFTIAAAVPVNFQPIVAAPVVLANTVERAVAVETATGAVLRAATVVKPEPFVNSVLVTPPTAEVVSVYFCAAAGVS